MHPFWRGFFPGLVVGMAIALLLAPASGEENRAAVRQRFAAALDAGRQAARAEEARLRARYRRNVTPSTARHS